ncbi:peroxisomal coenzyme A diphosphatase NUDT7-like [Parus major]|uniref:peroxisomal coenzyme A diphosphatase NUDT7-like n=1 Tax=Parus major TaxID=9157 RepID=UPI00077152D2|nr:peroxisomal coenzyme A diphosphatase NUDT7-like [Parus major]
MEEARRRLREFDVGDKFSRLPLPRAAVLLPLTVREGRLHLLLTVRSMQEQGQGTGSPETRDGKRAFPESPPIVYLDKEIDSAMQL